MGTNVVLSSQLCGMKRGFAASSEAKHTEALQILLDSHRAAADHLRELLVGVALRHELHALGVVLVPAAVHAGVPRRTDATSKSTESVFQCPENHEIHSQMFETLKHSANDLEYSVN